MTVLEGFIEEMQKVRSFEDLNKGIVALRDILEVDHVVYHSINSTGEQYAALTYSEDWVNNYIEQDYLRHDPVVQGSYRKFQPIDWKTMDWSSKGSREFLGEAIGAGVGNQGYSVPVRGPAGQFALFTVSGNETDDCWSKYTTQHSHNLILISHFINQKALELEGGSDEASHVSLSPREKDSLTLLAMGMNRAQAADELSISEHTLRVYIESARFKLAAANTTHAVARAMNYGLLVV